MKYLKTIAILIMIVGFPAGSWLFLQHGLEWRKVKRDQLVPKTHLMNELDWSPEEQMQLKELFYYKTTLLLCKDASVQSEVVTDQFKDAFTFQVKTPSDLPSSFIEKLDIKRHQYMIIDTGMVVRQLYPDDTDATISRLVEDLALIVPQRKERDIKVRGKE